MNEIEKVDEKFYHVDGYEDNENIWDFVCQIGLIKTNSITFPCKNLKEINIANQTDLQKKDQGNHLHSEKNKEQNNALEINLSLTNKIEGENNNE